MSGNKNVISRLRFLSNYFQSKSPNNGSCNKNDEINPVWLNMAVHILLKKLLVYLCLYFQPLLSLLKRFGIVSILVCFQFPAKENKSGVGRKECHIVCLKKALRMNQTLHCSFQYQIKENTQVTNKSKKIKFLKKSEKTLG